MELGDLSQRLASFRTDFKEGCVRTAGSDWRYALGGSDDTTLVILGGLGASHESMFSIALRLSNQRRILCLGIPAGITRPDQLNCGMADVLNQLGLERCALLGHSMGGMAGLVFTLASPARVSSLVLSNTGIYLGARRKLIPLASKCLGMLPPRLYRRLVVQQMERLLEKSPDRDFWLSFFIGELEGPNLLADHAELLSNLTERLGDGNLDSIRKLKTLIIQAEDDRGFSISEKSFLPTLFDSAHRSEPSLPYRPSQFYNEGE